MMNDDDALKNSSENKEHDGGPWTKMFSASWCHKKVGSHYVTCRHEQIQNGVLILHP